MYLRFWIRWREQSILCDSGISGIWETKKWKLPTLWFNHHLHSIVHQKRWEEVGWLVIGSAFIEEGH